MKGVFPLVGSLGSSCRYKRFLSCLGCPSRPPSTKYFFPRRTLFHLICPNRPASWAGSRAASPISYYVSLISTTCEQEIFTLLLDEAQKTTLLAVLLVLLLRYIWYAQCTWARTALLHAIPLPSQSSLTMKVFYKVCGT
jgi:hypothetical protein